MAEEEDVFEEFQETKGEEAEEGELEDKQNRNLQGWHGKLIKYAAIVFTLFQIYTAFFGMLPHMQQRSIFVGLGVFLILATKSVKEPKERERKIPWYDLILMGLILIITFYVALNYIELLDRRLFPENYEYVFAILVLVIGLEASRRSLGKALPILAGFFIIYTFFGQWFPGVWSHAGISLHWFVSRMYLTDGGYWGMLPGISTRIIAVFYIFGVVVVGIGGGRQFMKIALRLAGQFKGGAAKVASIGSTLMGMINGSGMANAAATGSLTIPMMKSLGYKAPFAAGVEAAASTGGQIMPPVMGAGAFLMAELTGIPYLRIIITAIIPALLFYMGNFYVIHFTAVKEEIKPVPKDKIPSWRSSFNLPAFTQLILPVVIIVWMLLRGRSVQYAGSWGLAFLLGGFALANWRHTVIEKAKILFEAFEDAGYSLATLASLALTAQIIVSLITASGVGPKFTELMVAIGGENLFIVLILGMIACIILGMGMPTTAAYVMGASLVAPALTRLGLPDLSSHMFVFYFAIISTITPPVCTGIYAAAIVAKIDWEKAVPDALRLGLVGFIVPFMFVYTDALLAQAALSIIIIEFIFKAIGVFALGAVTVGHMRTKLKIYEAMILLPGAILLAAPGWITNFSGLALAIIGFILNSRRSKRESEVEMA